MPSRQYVSYPKPLHGFPCTKFFEGFYFWSVFARYNPYFTTNSHKITYLFLKLVTVKRWGSITWQTGIKLRSFCSIHFRYAVYLTKYMEIPFKGCVIRYFRYEFARQACVCNKHKCQWDTRSLNERIWKPYALQTGVHLFNLINVILWHYLVIRSRLGSKDFDCQ